MSPDAPPSRRHRAYKFPVELTLRTESIVATLSYDKRCAARGARRHLGTFSSYSTHHRRLGRPVLPPPSAATLVHHSVLLTPQLLHRGCAVFLSTVIVSDAYFRFFFLCFPILFSSQFQVIFWPFSQRPVLQLLTGSFPSIHVHRNDNPDEPV